MKRVRIIPSTLMPLFAPRITIFTKDGRSYTKQATGREFIWDFEEEARRIRGVVDGIPIPAAQFEEMISTCRDLDRQARADRLVQLTLRGWDHVTQTHAADQPRRNYVEDPRGRLPTRGVNSWIDSLEGGSQCSLLPLAMYATCCCGSS